MSTRLHLFSENNYVKTKISKVYRFGSIEQNIHNTDRYVSLKNEN